MYVGWWQQNKGSESGNRGNNGRDGDSDNNGVGGVM